ncbi:MAG: N-acetyl sugar amidotransferase [Legionellaceae bacterium]|nr:N-acetyl sugar amidotransferase [Legionellaceae bacterium]
MSGLSKDYQVCNNCVMDTTDDDISFDENGICDHCNDFYNLVLPHWHTDDRGWQKLEPMLDKIKKEGRGKDFDCILGLSGGVDSSYLAHKAKEFGLRPLFFHVDGGWNSQVAVNNIQVLVDKLGCDLYTEVINWEEMKDFQLSYFKSGLSSIDIPQDHAFIATLYNFASKYKIKHILNGGNYSTECVCYPMSWLYYGTDMAQIRDIRKKFGTIPMDTYPFSGILKHKVYLRYVKKVQVLKPLNYIPYVKSNAVDLLQAEYGWQPYRQKHFESRFTKFYEGYWLFKKFGYDTRKVQFSSLILTKQMTRDDALEALSKPAMSDDEIRDDFEYIAKKLSISVDELQAYLDAPNKTYKDYRNQERMFMVGAKIMQILRLERTVRR